MNKADIAILERLFSSEVDSAVGGKQWLPVQLKGKRVEALEKNGLVERCEVTLPGRFPVRVVGWRLTASGHLAYCMEC